MDETIFSGVDPDYWYLDVLSFLSNNYEYLRPLVDVLHEELADADEYNMESMIEHVEYMIDRMLTDMEEREDRLFFIDHLDMTLTTN